VKAARLHRYDESIPADSLRVEEIEEPKIENPFDVIVRVGAAGLCRTDIHVVEGQWAPIQDPDGTLLPYVLGHIGIQCLKALTPAEIIVTDPNEKALELAKEWGADETVKVEDGYVDTVLEMTDGKGAEVVFDYVGERGAEDDAWRMTRQGGSHYVIGYGGTVEVPTIDIISTERVITGNLVGTYNDLAELMILTARGLVTLHTSTYPLDAVNDAIQDLNNGNLQGRGILIPDGAAS
jgi:NAD+-dependent secondary alcohol dehydrogenase Adh1